MSVLEKIMSVLADKDKSTDEQYDELRRMLDEGEIGKAWRGPNSSILPGQEKLAGIDYLIRDSGGFFVTRGIRAEDWADIRREALDVMKIYLKSGSDKVDDLPEFQVLQKRTFDRARELAESGKYPAERVSKWFEMGY